MKARIRKNGWGNWYGYYGNRKVIAFANDAVGSQEDHAREWLAQRERVRCDKKPETRKP